MHRLDRVAAFFSAFGSVLGGIPGLFISLYLGLLYGGGNGRPEFLFWELLGTQVFAAAAVLTLPTYAACLLLTLFSEVSRIRIFYVVFSVSAIAAVQSQSDWARENANKTWRLYLLPVPPLVYFVAKRKIEHAHASE